MHSKSEQAEQLDVARVDASSVSHRPPDAGRKEPRIARRAATGAMVGTFIEYYDFSVYGFLAVIIAPIFFPGSDPVAALLATLLVFASAWIVRPFGGIFFGYIGDRYGRKPALLMALIMIGVASTFMGLLPTYQQIGAWATLLLLLARLAQGFSTGGEVAGAITLVSESVPKNRRSFYASFTPLGSTLGFAAGALAAGVVASLTTDAQMASWGWRLPFLLSLPLTVFCVWARTRIVETLPTSVVAEQSDGRFRKKLSVATVFSNRANIKGLAQTIFLSVATNATVYIGLTYLGIHLVRQLGYESASVYWASVVYITIVALCMPLGGLLGDRIGATRAIAIGLLGFAVITYPAMLLMHVNLIIATLACCAVLINTVFVQAGVYTVVPRLFPREARYSGVALGWNLGAVAAGGTAPYAAVWLVDRTGNSLSPAFLVIGAAVIGFVTLLTIMRNKSDSDDLHTPLAAREG